MYNAAHDQLKYVGKICGESFLQYKESWHVNVEETYKMLLKY